MKWSKLRKNIKEKIVPELCERVDFHVTKYRDAQYEIGEFWITVDKEKVFGGGTYHFINKLTEDFQINGRKYFIDHNLEFTKVNIQDLDIINIMSCEIHDTTHFSGSLFNYLNTGIEESLKSKNPFFRAFALIDKRCGKRKLKEIKIDENEHKLIKLFYELRIRESS